MKLTLLDMVQDILSDLNSDAVNTIGETPESMQVANMVRRVYFDLCSVRDWPFLRTLTALTGLGDTTRPTSMRMPEGMNKLLWVKYNRKECTWMEPKDFSDMIGARSVQLGVVDPAGYELTRDPIRWTSYDDDVIVFDAIDLAVDNTLYEAKSTVYGVMTPAWSHTDDFVPLLPDKMFPTLLADAKSTAFLIEKQTPNQKEEQKAHKGMVRWQNEAWRNDQAESRTNLNINYGRK